MYAKEGKAVPMRVELDVDSVPRDYSIDLEMFCEGCRENTWTGGPGCEKCAGTGLQLTREGKAWMGFIRRHIGREE
jgi:hypothetical protein